MRFKRTRTFGQVGKVWFKSKTLALETVWSWIKNWIWLSVPPQNRPQWSVAGKRHEKIAKQGVSNLLKEFIETIRTQNKIPFASLLTNILISFSRYHKADTHNTHYQFLFLKFKTFNSLWCIDSKTANRWIYLLFFGLQTKRAS